MLGSRCPSARGAPSILPAYAQHSRDCIHVSTACLPISKSAPSCAAFKKGLLHCRPRRQVAGVCTCKAGDRVCMRFLLKRLHKACRRGQPWRPAGQQQARKQRLGRPTGRQTAKGQQGPSEAEPKWNLLSIEEYNRPWQVQRPSKVPSESFDKAYKFHISKSALLVQVPWGTKETALGFAAWIFSFLLTSLLTAPLLIQYAGGNVQVSPRRV